MRSRGIAQLDSAREALASLDMASEDEARLWKKLPLSGTITPTISRGTR